MQRSLSLCLSRAWLSASARTWHSNSLPHSLYLYLSLSLSACAPEHGTIGALLSQRDDHTLVVREAPEGLAAAKAGVQQGDELLLIDGRDVRTMSPAEVHRALSGEVGQPVKLTLVRGDRIVRVTLSRSPAQPAKGPKGKG